MLLEAPRGVQGPQAEGWLAGQGVPRLREQARWKVNGTVPGAQEDDYPPNIGSLMDDILVHWKTGRLEGYMDYITYCITTLLNSPAQTGGP